MADKINGRTPEEIKQGLECFIESTGGRCLKPYIYCRECPKHVPGYMVEDKWKNALAYIQQLESERDQYKRERDAAVEDVYRSCDTCKHSHLNNKTGSPCVFRMDCYMRGAWQWRGVQEVE